MALCCPQPSRYRNTSQSSVYRYIELFEYTCDVKPKSYRHGPPKLLGDMGQLLLLKLILNNPGIYLSEIREKLLSTFGVNVNISTICRTLKFMGCTRQVIQRVALQRSDTKRAKFMAEVSMYDPLMLLWIDESGHDLRNYMWLQCARYDTSRPQVDSTRHSLLGHSSDVP